MRTILVALLLATLASAAPVPKELKKDDAGRFVGEWWESRQGDATYPDAATARRFTYDADGGLGIRQNATAPPTLYSIAIDRMQAVPCFAFKQSGTVIYNAAYRFDGDTLSFALTVPNQPLATEIKPGAGVIFYELKRLR
jgi:hypothetical protein